MFISDWYILPAALLLDFILGDPRKLPHPIRWMGRGIEVFEPFFRKHVKNPRLAGMGFALSLMVVTLLLANGLLATARFVHPYLGAVVEIIMIYYTLSVFSLKKEAIGVLHTLKTSGLDEAKKKLAMIVGRDVEPLDEEGVTRAALETVAENFVDGVLSPLFWAAIGGAPLAMLYKMVNTMDSMVGYKNDTYLEFGSTAAKIDDAFNFIPARLSVPVITAAVFLKKGPWKQTWDTGWHDGSRHASPNAGFPEAAFAGALGVRLGGPNLYGGVIVEKPYIGGEFDPVTGQHLRGACTLLIFCALVGIFGAMTLAHIVSMIY